ncbi:hypothetical protein MGSAQ_002865, partial [marine sediment metagenome]
STAQMVLIYQLALLFLLFEAIEQTHDAIGQK